MSLKVFEGDLRIDCMVSMSRLPWSADLSQHTDFGRPVAWPKRERDERARCIITSVFDGNDTEFTNSMRIFLLNRSTELLHDSESRINYLVYEYKYHTTDIFNRTGVWGEHDTI